MSEPQEPLPPEPVAAPPPSPFRPETVASLTPAGCGRPLAIGCMLFLVLIGAAGLIVVSKQDQFVAFYFGLLETGLEHRLGPEVAEADKLRLRKAFEAAAAKARSGQYTTEQLQRVQGPLLIAAQDPSISKADLDELLPAVEAFGGVKPAPATGPTLEARPGPATEPPAADAPATPQPPASSKDPAKP